MEHILYDDNQPLRAAISNYSWGYFGFSNEFNIDFFWYDRKSPEDMKPLLLYGSQEKYIDYLFVLYYLDYTLIFILISVVIILIKNTFIAKILLIKKQNYIFRKKSAAKKE